MSDESIESRPPDPFVASRVNNPAEPPAASFQLAGLLGDSDREGYRRLYLSTSLDYYVEFKSADVLAVEAVSPETAPFVGLDATRVTLKRDAAVEYVRSRTGPPEGFELDVQPGVPVGFTPDPNGPTGGLPTDFTTNITTDFQSAGVGCVPDTIFDDCNLPPRTWWTCGPTRCFTQRTCVTACNTCGGTCVTCGNATCRTCFQATCQTCAQTTCRTCGNVTCRTLNLQDCWRTIAGPTCTPGLCGISQAIRCPTVPACP
ncbi:MAG: hypothetical protein ACLGHZ_09665 [Actinomycetes bacterium]